MEQNQKPKEEYGITQKDLEFLIPRLEIIDQTTRAIISGRPVETRDVLNCQNTRCQRRAELPFEGGGRSGELGDLSAFVDEATIQERGLSRQLPYSGACQNCDQYK